MKPHFTVQPDYSASADIKIHEPDVESVVREAAFVSSEGKVYRLFSENENPAFGNPFTLPSSPFVKDTTNIRPNGCGQIESPSPSAKKLLCTAPFPAQSSFGQSENKQVNKQANKQNEHPPLEETFKKMRAVEGICGRSRKTVSSSLFLLPQEQNGQTKNVWTKLPPKHYSEIKPSAIPLVQIMPESSIPPAAHIDLPELTPEKQTVQEKQAVQQDGTLNFKETEIKETGLKKTEIKKEISVHLTAVNLPETLCRRSRISGGTLFRKKKPFKVNCGKHHLPANTENQVTAAFLAAGEEFRTDAAAVWSERVETLEERALQQIKKLSVHLIELYNQGKRVICLNSFFSGEGCTTVAACAARELASRGYYVLLADTNEHHPELTAQFSPLADPDIYGIIPLEEKLHFLPFCDAMIESETDGKPVTQRFTQLIAAMKNDYDFILLDNGGLSEHRLEERVKHWNEMKSDGVMLVLKQQNIQRINVNAVSRRLKEHHVELAGVAENYVPDSIQANPAGEAA